MQIHVATVAGRFATAAPTLYVLQIANTIDPQTGSITMPAASRTQIESAFQVVEGQRPFSFFVLPEMAVPFSFVPDFVEMIKRNAESLEITVAGLEIAPVYAYRELINELPVEAKNASALHRLLAKCDPERPLNACLIAFCAPNVPPRVYVQPKVSPSRRERALEALRDLVRGDTLNVFAVGDLAFTALLCSDFFQSPDGSARYRIVDQLDYQIIRRGTSKLRRGASLRLLFDLQYEPVPDSPQFLHSVSRLFDVGTFAAKELCIVSANTSIGGAHAGLSKILFLKGQPLFARRHLRSAQPTRALEAPVVGLEFGSSSRLVRLEFERQWPWDQDVEAPTAHVKTWRKARSGWARDSPPYYNAVVDNEGRALVEDVVEDAGTALDIAKLYSQRGEFRAAISHATRALTEVAEESEQAQIRLFLGTQERHRGNYPIALQYYYEALKILAGRSGDERRVLEGRLRGAIILVDDYLLQGRCRTAKQKWEQLLAEAERELRRPKLKRNRQNILKTYILHARRHAAEMTRLLGDYGEAATAFREIETQYGPDERVARAYSALGEGECHRMRFDLEAAESCYQRVEGIAAETGDIRLRTRLAAAKAEFHRVAAELRRSEIERDLCRGELATLLRLAESAMYPWGLIYWNLISGGLALTSDADLARHHFDDAIALTSDDGAVGLPIECAHAQFGLAEASGFKGRRSRENLKTVEEIYTEAGIRWGIERTKYALGLRLNALDDAVFTDARILFINIP